MKRSRFAEFFVLSLLMVAFLPSFSSASTQGSSEELTGYVAGSSVLWYMRFGGVNVSAAAVSAAEGALGVTSYNLTMIDTVNWTPDFQAFGPSGYNLIPTPFIPTQGAFLTVKADSFSGAASAAASFGSYLYTTLFSYSNGTGTYMFYGTVPFAAVVPSAVLKFLPQGTGFAAALTGSSLLSTKSPIVILSGMRGVSGFVHDLVVGSISTGALSTTSGCTNCPALLKYFGSTIPYLQSSNRSTSSVIGLHFLDGMVNSSDKAIVSTNSYSLSLTPGEKVYGINATVAQTPTFLLVQRVIDSGALLTNQNVSVTLSFSNPSGPSNLTTIGFSDDWWKSYSFFKLVRGDSAIQSYTFAPGKSASPTYVLQYTGGTAQQVTIPPRTVDFSYKVGSKVFHGHAQTNTVPLSLGSLQPVLLAYARPFSTGTPYGSPIGTSSKISIVVKNVGNLTALSVVIAGQQLQGGALVAGSSTEQFVSVTAHSLQATNYSMTYAVTYSTPSGSSLSVSTNPVPVLFSHSNIQVGLPRISSGAAVSFPSPGKTNLTISYSVSNGGTVDATNFVASGRISPGLGCGTIKGTGLSCSSGEVSMDYHALGASSNDSSLGFIITSPLNYYFPPMTFHTTEAGLNLSGSSDGLVAPSGITLSKAFTVSQLFGDMSSIVRINGLNSGPFHAYNATIVSSADGSFDSVNGSSSKTAKDLAPGGNVTASYGIKVATGASGNVTTSNVGMSFYLGGVQYTLTNGGPNVVAFKPLTVSITAKPPIPTEGSQFSIGMSIHNPSPVTVSNVKFSLPIPSAMQLSNIHNANFSSGTLTITIDQLAAKGVYNATMSAQASSGITLLFSSGMIHFDYSGATVFGSIPKKDIVVGENVLLRYTIPTAIVLLAVLAAAYYVRRNSIAPGSQR